MAGVYITGIGSFLPNEPVDNDRIEDVLGHVNKRSTQVKRWVLEHNGIQSRHYAIDPSTKEMTHTNAQLTALAVKAALKDAGADLGSVECLVCGTSAADQIIPSHAAMVHGELGSHPCEVVSTSGVCCSGASSMKYGFMSVASGASKNAVVTGSELASVTLRSAHFESEMKYKLEDLETRPMLAFENDFLRWMLSDGAGAFYLSNTPRQDGMSIRIDWMDLVSFANEVETCMYFGGKKVEGGALEGYRAIVDPSVLYNEGYLSLAQDVTVLREGMPKFFRKAFVRSQQARKLDPSQIDWVLPHYSSDAFREPLYNGLVEVGCPIPWEKWFTNLPTKGNIGSASIYVILEELVSSGRAKKGQRILCLIPESARFTFAVVHMTVV